MWTLILTDPFRQGDGTRRISVPELARVHTRAIPERGRFAETERGRTHRVWFWSPYLCRALFCRYVRVVRDRQGVGRVQDLETPGRERGGDARGTVVFDWECGVSDDIDRCHFFFCSFDPRRGA